MAVNLDKMSREELLDLKKRVDNALKVFERRKKREALAAARKAALDHGFSLDEIVGGAAKGPKTKSAPKYANPADPSQTWTGRGRQPGWIKDALKKGKKLESMAI